MSRPIIICPSCHRELYHLHQAQCSWCGADLPENEFEKVALPIGELPTPDLPPLPQSALPTGFSQGNFGWGPLSPQNYQLSLNFNLALLLICVMLIPLAYFLWERSQVHQIVPTSYKTRYTPPRSFENPSGR
jgi:hypothetical protein